jgi:hypothetical protein
VLITYGVRVLTDPALRALVSARGHDVSRCASSCAATRAASGSISWSSHAISIPGHAIAGALRAGLPS